MKTNRDLIAKKRRENKMLHKKLADSKAGDERVLNVAFKERNVERAALRGKSGKVNMIEEAMREISATKTHAK